MTYCDPRPSGSAPGDLEARAFECLPQELREYLYEEYRERPEFLDEYLIHALRLPNPEAAILDDMAREMLDYDSELAGLGLFGTFKKVFRKIKDLHKKIESKIVPKFIRKIHERVSKEIGRTWHKYGSIIITVAGAVLAPFTAGASLALAAVAQAVNSAYNAKRAADKAKQMGSRDAHKLKQEAAAQEHALNQQLDQFFHQNESWFAQHGITYQGWSSLSTDQKVELIKAGSEGRMPQGAVQISAPAGAGAPTGGYAGGGYGGGYSSSTGTGAQPSPLSPQAADGQKVATEGMFGDLGSFLPWMMGGGLLLSILQSKGKKGGRRRYSRSA